MPKCHQFDHLLRQTPQNGNPMMYANYLDDTLNRLLAKIAGRAYSSVWETRVLMNWIYARDHGMFGLVD